MLGDLTLLSQLSIQVDVGCEGSRRPMDLQIDVCMRLYACTDGVGL